MANKLVLKAKKIYLAGYDISAESNQVALDGMIEELDSSNFASAAKEAEPGLEAVKGTVGVMLPTTFDWEKSLFDGRGARQLLSFLVEGSSVGSVAYGLSGLSLKHYPGAQVGQLLGTTIELVSKGVPLVRGQALEFGTERTATVTGNEIQIAGGVPSGKSLYVFLHVIKMTATSLGIVLQRDDNGGFASPVTAITFATYTAIGAELGSVAGPITDDRFRLSFTLTGAGAYQVAAVIAVQ